MRTTIANRFSESLTSIQRHARQMADEQVRLSGGTKFLRASDSPLAMGKAVDLRTTAAQLDSLGRLQSAAANRMTETEAALRDAGTVLDDLHQLYAMTQNASIGKQQLVGLSSQAVVLQEELKQILSRADATGYRIFNTSDLKVIVDGGTAGVDPVSINTIGVLAGLEMLNPSAEIDWDTVTDNEKLDDAVEKLVYGEDSVLNSFVAALKAGDAEAIRANNERSVVRNNEFRAAADEMIQQQIRVGAAQARVDRSVQRTEDLKLSVSTALSNEVDTDFAESTMEVQKAKALLEAAQSITATIGSMNLFQRLG
jgi:flagellin-like hook-associated protein FlgL